MNKYPRKEKATGHQNVETFLLNSMKKQIFVADFKHNKWENILLVQFCIAMFFNSRKDKMTTEFSALVQKHG